MLVKKDFTSKLALNNPESYSITSLANSKIILMVNPLVVIHLLCYLENFQLSLTFPGSTQNVSHLKGILRKN